ncbi:methyl-accepting chemotaxis protein [Brevundimonas sp. SL130]|uniref:methyl-accepting chemotaxis protein n=1 Tax=Brevundimonas sp. SL130 TaxID=2995143 RepID=UPI00226CFE96|nr:methyl-accepting chemotaxis protein [Brevundimonas sp. SL130]WAC59859.1 methyl-accepting chemotaxis protein [Brevundimonas sp. SL130]
MRFTIKAKLIMTFGLLIVAISVLVGVSLTHLSSLNAGIHHVLAGPAAQLSRTQSIETEFSGYVRRQRGMLLSEDPNVVREMSSENNQARANLDQLLAQGQAATSEQAGAEWVALAQAWAVYKPIGEEIDRRAVAGDKAGATGLMMNEARASLGAIEEAAERIVKTDKALMGEADEEATAVFEEARNSLIIAAVIALLGAIAGCVGIILVVSKGLARACEAVRLVAEGDLTKNVAVTSRDEIGDMLTDLNRMIERLRGVIGDALSAADNVSAGSQELSSSSEQMSQGATEQAAAAEQASASMEEMAANIKQNADNAAQTEKISRQSSKDAETSGEAVHRAVDAMRTIVAKIGIVQEIARQTDLLALNAAVEAARAGEHGKGFAVVASEVRKLAERSQTAAAEIGAVSGDTVKAAQDAGEMLQRLVPDIRKTAELVSEISAACREQDVGAAQINDAIQQLDKVIQQNAGAAEEMSATSEELAAQAEELQTSIAFFRTDAAGTPARDPVRARARPATFKAARPASPAIARPHVHAQQARAQGFALDMTTGGADAEDMDFRESA